MKYLCIGYFDPAKMDALSPERVEALMQQCPPHMQTMYDTGQVAMVAGADNAARYLRVVGGKLDVSDHPAEASAKIGCVFLLEAPDMEQAVRLAALHPTTQIPGGEALGWRTEVRPVHDFYRGEDELLGKSASGV